MSPDRFFTPNRIRLKIPPLPDFLKSVFWNRDVRLTYFMSVDDTNMAVLTSYRMVSDLYENNPHIEKLQIIELCFGSGLVSYALLLDTKDKWPLHMHCVGLEVDNSSVSISRDNAIALGIKDISLLEGCSFDLKMRQEIKRLYQPESATAFIINPPYVPCPPDKKTETCVNGGPDGTEFYDKVVFEYLEMLEEPDATLLFSSICNIDKIFKKIDDHGYHIADATFCIVPFGKYTMTLAEYIKNEVPNNYVCTDTQTCELLFSDRPLQVVIGLVISRDRKPSTSFTPAKINQFLHSFQTEGFRRLADFPDFMQNLWKLDYYELLDLHARYKR